MNSQQTHFSFVLFAFQWITFSELSIRMQTLKQKLLSWMHDKNWKRVALENAKLIFKFQSCSLCYVYTMLRQSR